MTSSELGLNVEEADGPQAISAAPTSVAAFVGYTSAGPVDEAVRLSSFSEFERLFGGLHPTGPLSHAVSTSSSTAAPPPGWSGSSNGEAEGRADGPAIPTAMEILGSRAGKSGLYALKDAPAFNILNLPEVTDPAALTEALDYAEERRSMLLIDMGPDVNTPAAARAWIEDPARDGLRRANAAVHFPRIAMRDPNVGSVARSFANSGAIAGLWARSDAAKGVWKAPAALDAGLIGAQELAYALTDGENGVLSPLGINGLRDFSQAGVVSWGARTMSRDPTWRYVPVRRLALLVEESLVSGLRFAAVEPNGEPLWAQIRRRVGAFLHDLFRQGAFPGAPRGRPTSCGAARTRRPRPT
jgi:phage tail sheath protein FI